MFRRDKWWHREIEKVRREHAAREAELVATICRLAGKPLPPAEPVAIVVEPAEPDTHLVYPDQFP